MSISHSLKTMLHRWTTALVGLVLAIIVSAPAFADEIITRFASDVELRRDGSVLVTETISVRAEGEKIKRGIYRDIPTLLINDDGSQLHSKLEIISIKKNGIEEPWFPEVITNGTRIYIGDRDVYLDAGKYRYTITYTMTRMARRFEEYDELFWNATGNFWDFPIREAVAQITLPDGAVIGNITGYTGGFGSTEQALTTDRSTDNQAIFRATRELGAYEGMSVSVGFQKGILDELSSSDQAANWLSDHRHIVLPLLAALIIASYYFFFWSRIGRDPEKGTIIPLFHAPVGYSPALTHYIWAMGWKRSGWQAFIAAIINLGVKGLLDISTTSLKTTTLKVIGHAEKLDQPLPPGEQSVFNYLRSKGEIEIGKKSGPGLATQKSMFVSLIEQEHRHAFFRNNIGYVVFGFVLSLLVIIALVFLKALSAEWLIISILAGGIFAIFSRVVRAMANSQGVKRVFHFALAGFLLVNIGSGVFRSFNLDTIFILNTSAIATTSIIAINLIFAFLMGAPTARGREVMDQIEGFRMYLDTAEKERLNFVGEPDMSVVRFEAILPYAIALGVEKPWTQRFEGELARNAISGAQGYHPGWYHSSSFSSSNLSSDMASMATGMSAAMIAAQPASSSSSGSSGGGSSGGGGGGGGGGGW